MKKLFVAISTFAAFAITSCKDDFNVAAPYKNITFAYAIFNADDTAHYIRIEKAFLDENKSAIEMAKQYDSSFYKDLNVKVEECSADGVIKRTFTLEKVDLVNEGYIKQQPGNQGFFTTPNYAYKFKFPVGQTFDPFLKYRVIIKNNVTNDIDSSDLVGIVNNRTTKDANNFYIPDFANGNYTIGFAPTTNQSSFTLYGNTPVNGKWIQGIIRFRIVEKDIVNQTSKADTLDYLFDSKTSDPTKQFTLQVLHSAFYSFLKNELGAAPANVERYIDSCNVYVYCGSNELYTFETINNVQSGGLLGDQIRPIYSNFKGGNTYGMVGSRAMRAFMNAPIDKVTLDSLKSNPITRDMAFKDVTSD